MTDRQAKLASISWLRLHVQDSWTPLVGYRHDDVIVFRADTRRAFQSVSAAFRMRHGPPPDDSADACECAMCQIAGPPTTMRMVRV